MTSTNTSPRAQNVLLSAIALLMTGGLLYAGPLNPPAGPIASTSKTLYEVEPRIAINATNTPGDAAHLFRVTQPGSYYLSQNVSVPATASWGISVEASGVTLDLNGFTIDGNGNNAGGITVDQPGVTIRNGTITRTTLSGISSNLFPTGSPGLTVESVRVLNILGEGIPIGGSPGAATAGIFGGRGAIIRNCYVNDAALGIAAGFNSNISGCTVEFARQHAFHIQGGATITDCVAVGTLGTISESAYVLGAGSTAVNCIARSNNGYGFIAESECSLKGCSSTNNLNSGFSVRSSTVSNCMAVSNAGDGISAFSACRIESNTVEQNGNHGIIISGGRSSVLNNLVASNGIAAGSFAGISCDGFSNTIDSNHVTGMVVGNDDYGIRTSITGSSNIIIRNILSANSTHLFLPGGDTSGGSSATPATASSWANIVN